MEWGREVAGDSHWETSQPPREEEVSHVSICDTSFHFILLLQYLPCHLYTQDASNSSPDLTQTRDDLDASWALLRRRVDGIAPFGHWVGFFLRPSR